MNEDDKKALARLTTQLAISNAQISANPFPYIDKLTKELIRLLKVLESVEYALSPDYVFDFWNENDDKSAIRNPIDIRGEALIRCNKALEILRIYSHESYSHGAN